MDQLAFHTVGLTDRESREWTRKSQGLSSTLPAYTAAGLLVVAVVYSVALRPVIAVAREAGVDLAQAKYAVKVARVANAGGNLVLAEAVDKARVINQALADGERPGTVSGISFVEVGGLTSAMVRSPISGVTVHFTVSGTDGYYNTGALRTDDQGRVSFKIPEAHRDILDSISVWAVLSDKLERTKFVW